MLLRNFLPTLEVAALSSEISSGIGKGSPVVPELSSGVGNGGHVASEKPSGVGKGIFLKRKSAPESAKGSMLLREGAFSQEMASMLVRNWDHFLADGRRRFGNRVRNRKGWPRCFGNSGQNGKRSQLDQGFGMIRSGRPIPQIVAATSGGSEQLRCHRTKTE